MKAIKKTNPVRIPRAVKKNNATGRKTARPQNEEGEPGKEIEKEVTDTKHQHDYKTPLGHDQNDTLTPGERTKSEDANEDGNQHGRPPERSEEKQEEEKQEEKKKEEEKTAPVTNK
jgi:hypothetical protein